MITFLFSYMLPRQQLFTLLPYTTLFRSVVAAPPIKTGAQAVKRPVIIKRQSKMATGLRKSWRLIIGVLRVIGYQYRHTWRGAGQYGPLGCAWCDDGAHRDGCLCWPGQRRFYRHHYRSGQ